MILYPIIVALFKTDKIGKQRTWLFINESINKMSMHTHGRILFRYIIQRSHAHWHNMEEPGRHDVKWNNPDQKDKWCGIQVICDIWKCSTYNNRLDWCLLGSKRWENCWLNEFLTIKWVNSRNQIDRMCSDYVIHRQQLLYFLNICTRLPLREDVCMEGIHYDHLFTVLAHVKWSLSRP